MVDRAVMWVVAVGCGGYLGALFTETAVPEIVHLLVGMPLVLILPGFTLIRLLRLETGDTLETGVLAVGMSLVETTLLGALIHFAPQTSLEPDVWRPALAILVGAQAALPIVSREVPDDEPTAVPRPWPVLAGVVPIAVLAIAGWISIRSAAATEGASFTQLWAVQEEGSELVVGVRNLEGRDERYLLTVTVGDEVEVLEQELRLDRGQSWERTLDLAADPSGGQVEARLYRSDADEDEPYRWVELPSDADAAATSPASGSE